MSLIRAFDIPGLAFSMANPFNTNGGQFFICEVATPHLDDRHAVFGRVTNGWKHIAESRCSDRREPGDSSHSRTSRDLPQLMRAVSCRYWRSFAFFPSWASQRSTFTLGGLMGLAIARRLGLRISPVTLPFFAGQVLPATVLFGGHRH